MKANEAPENIYLLPDEKNPNGLSICWYEAPYRTGAIEYIRADAFIEKAAEQLNNFYNEDTHSYLIDEDIEDFKNYVKGE